MLKLLLDEHISPEVAEGFRARNTSTPIHAVVDFENPRLSGISDAELLYEAGFRGLTLVTYDVRTIPLLLKKWGDQGRTHSGVIFINQKTIFQNDYGSIVRSLLKLAAVTGNQSWENRIVFLPK